MCELSCSSVTWIGIRPLQQMTGPEVLLIQCHTNPTVWLPPVSPPPSNPQQREEVTLLLENYLKRSVNMPFSISPAHISSLSFSQPPAPNFIPTLQWVSNFDLQLPLLPTPQCHHHLPLVQCSGKQTSDERSEHSMALVSLPELSEVMGVCCAPPPQTYLLQILEIFFFPHQQDGRQAWEPGEQAAWGHVANPAVEPSSPTSPTQQRHLKFRSWSDVMKMWYSPPLTIITLEMWTFPCSDSTPLTLLGGGHWAILSVHISLFPGFWAM